MDRGRGTPPSRARGIRSSHVSCRRWLVKADPLYRKARPPYGEGAPSYPLGSTVRDQRSKPGLPRENLSRDTLLGATTRLTPPGCAYSTLPSLRHAKSPPVTPSLTVAPHILGALGLGMGASERGISAWPKGREGITTGNFPYGPNVPGKPEVHSHNQILHLA